MSKTAARKPGAGQKIERLFAWVSIEPDGGEGVLGASMRLQGRDMFVPLVGADREEN